MSAPPAGAAAPLITIPRFAPITNMTLQYNGGTEFLSVPGILLGQTLPQLTIEAWVYLNPVQGSAPPTNQMIWQNVDANSTAFFVGFQNTTLQFGYNSANVFSFNYPFTAYEWYYIVITYNVTAAQIVLYVNGLGTTPGTLTTPQPVKIGPARVGSTFLGNIGSVRVWRGLLDQSYVQRLMYITLTGSVQVKNADGLIIATLIGNWRCDEGYGDLAFDYTGSMNAVLGGGDPTSGPDWVVSTALKPPDFIGLLGNPALTNRSSPPMVFTPVAATVLTESTEPADEAVVEEKARPKSRPQKPRPVRKAAKRARRKEVKK